MKKIVNILNIFFKKSNVSLYAAKFLPLVTEPGNRFLQDATNSTSLSGFLQAAFNLSIVFAAVLAVLRITWGGFLYMTSDIADNKNKAKSIIWNALLGLLLILSIYIILLQINPNILNLDVNLKSVEPTKSSTQTTTGSTGSTGSVSPSASSPDTTFFGIFSGGGS